MTMTAQETADGLMDLIHADLESDDDDDPGRNPFGWRDFPSDVAHRDAIEAALLAERKAALAEAAGVATVHGKTARLTGDHNTGYVTACKRIAAAILALSPEGKGPTDPTPEEET